MDLTTVKKGRGYDKKKKQKVKNSQDAVLRILLDTVKPSPKGFPTVQI